MATMQTKTKTKTKAKKSPRRKRAPSASKYIVTDGDMVLQLEPDETGGYVVSCPFVQGCVTQAETLEEAFEMARDAAELLQESYRDMPRRSSRAVAS